MTVDSACQKVVLDQEEYLTKVLDKFGMQDSALVPTPMVAWLSAVNSGVKLHSKAHELYRAIVGSLLCHTHMVAAKHLFRYLNGTKQLGLVFSAHTNSVNILWGNVDLDWAGCPDSRKSTSGYALMLHGTAISWKSKSQSVIAFSSAEAEFVAALSMVQEDLRR